MEAFEIIISSVLAVYIPGSAAYIVNNLSSLRQGITHNDLSISRLEGDLKVNASKDESIYSHLTRMETELKSSVDEIKKDIGTIKEDIATMKGRGK